MRPRGGKLGRPFYAITDPAVDAATSTAVIDANDGVLITLTGPGNPQTLQNPSSPTPGRRFLVINNDTSTDSITVNGSTINPGETATYIWDGSTWIGVSGGTGAITVRDCNWDATVNATFTGITAVNVCSDADATAVGVAPGVVNIYIPGLTFVSDFNTTNGTNNCVVAAHTTTSRNVANPGTFLIGGWVAGTAHPTTRSTTLSFSSGGNNCSFDDLTSTIEVLVAGATDNFGAPIASHTTVALTTANTPFDQTVNNIRIRVDDTGGPMTNDNGRYKAQIRVDINIQAILGDSGRFSVRITHNNAGALVYQQGPMFFDNQPNTATLVGGTTTISETGGMVVTREISGVNYYTHNSQFTVTVSDIDYLNGDSYPILEQLEILGPEYNLPQLDNIIGPAITNWTNDWNDLDDSYTKTDWAVTPNNNFCVVTTTANITSNIYDWGLVESQNSPNEAMCMNTYVPNATRIYEDFRLEEVGSEVGAYRLTSALVGPWDNTQDLNAYDDTLGLQYQCSRLIYPQTNFTIYNPSPVGQPNYAGSAGIRTWYRRMWHTGVSHPVGRFRLTDHNITEADLAANNVIIDISLNGVAWYTLNSLYVGGPLLPGQGCRTDKDQYGLPGNAPNPENNQIAFGLGTGGFTALGTGGGWGIYIRIRYGNGQTTKYIGVFEEVTWI